MDVRDSPKRQPMAMTFGIKSTDEIIVDGQPGLLLKGWASRYNEIDLDGEYQVKGSLLESIDTWAARDKPPILYNHGRDPFLGKREIGHAVTWDFNDDGLYVESFIPRDICDRWTAPGAKAARTRFRQVYDDIKAGVIRGYSVGGDFTRYGKALLSWAMTELTVAPRQCLPSATFTVGAKALAEEFGAETAPAETAPADLQALTERLDALEQAFGEKAAMKSEPDGAKHPASHYLVVGDPTKVTTWHLRYKNAQGQIDRGLCGACHAALLAPNGYRGNKYEGPDKQAAITKLRAIYQSQGWDWPDEGGSGGKAALLALAAQRPDLLDACRATIETYLRGEKAGRKHSKETIDAVRHVVHFIVGYFGPGILNPSDPDNDGDTDTPGQADDDTPPAA